jgi:hypothetical protein
MRCGHPGGTRRTQHVIYAHPIESLRVWDYEWHVALAAKGMAERDNHPMPKSVTTPEAFYEIMARAALDAIGLAALLERVARAERAERDLEITQEALRQADTKAENARHGRST